MSDAEMSDAEMSDAEMSDAEMSGSGELVLVGDELPADLQPDLADHQAYIFPNNNRRRVPGYLYLGIAFGLALIVLGFGDESVFVNQGLLWAAMLLSFFGFYSIISGWDLKIDEFAGLQIAASEVGFAVGHASAQMGWRGWLSRPSWRLLLYSAENPPLKRGFVLVDGVDGSVIESFFEDNPEDWSELSGVPNDSGETLRPTIKL